MKRSRKKSQGPGWTFSRACPTCGQVEDACRCHQPEPTGSQGTPVVRLRIEKRRGKPVTVIATENIAPDDLRTLMKELRSACATGGTLKGRDGELQGDHRDRLREVLAGRGFTVKG